jgi:hypothetical protein
MQRPATNSISRFIVVPGVGSTLLPKAWDDGNQNFWLKSIEPESAHDAGIFMFENRLCLGKPLDWQQIQDEGAGFVNALENMIDQDEVRFSYQSVVKPKH